jgi:uncharacterized protein
MIDSNLQKKLNKLSDILASYSDVAIAFSGGVDSTFLLKHAHDLLGDNVIAVTAVASIHAPDEVEEAIQFCTDEGIPHLLVNMDDSFLPQIAHNPIDRCYICKKTIFSCLMSHPTLEGLVVADGTNLDDAADFRPGEKALSELGVYSPLREAGLGKQDIRTALKNLGLSVWNKPSFACLASRIPYGEIITIEKLNCSYTLEKFLRENGFSQVRVRHHGEIARIEVLPEDMPKFFYVDFMSEINEVAKTVGFTYAALDLGGYKMGNLNK